MADSILDELNQRPVSYGLLLVMATLAYLTDSLGMNGNSAKLQDWGSCTGVLVMSGESWRLLSYALLHGNLIHIGFCGYMILSLGPRLEQALGSIRFLLLFAVSALGGSVATCLLYAPAQGVVGSSGAVFGMFGAALALNIRGSRTLLDFTQDRGSRQLIFLVVINLILGWVMPMISNTGHVGGLVVGFLFSFFILVPDPRGTADLLSRLVQLGVCLLLCSYTWLALQPVHRFDYRLRAYLCSPTPQWRSQLEDEIRGLSAEFAGRIPADAEEEPRTGLAIYNFLESDDAAPAFRRAVALWKADSPWLK